MMVFNFEPPWFGGMGPCRHTREGCSRAPDFIEDFSNTEDRFSVEAEPQVKPSKVKPRRVCPLRALTAPVPLLLGFETRCTAFMGSHF